MHFGLGTVSPFIDDMTSCLRCVDTNTGTNRWSGAWHLSPPRDVWARIQSRPRRAGRSRQTTNHHHRLGVSLWSKGPAALRIPTNKS